MSKSEDKHNNVSEWSYE